MIRPLASREPGAVREALVRRGFPKNRAISAAEGLRPVTLVFEEISAATSERVSRIALFCGLDVVSGDDWALISGSATRIGALTRSGANDLPQSLMEEIFDYLRSIETWRGLWRTARGTVGFGGPRVVGILNVTPDSFSDGGMFLDPVDAISHAGELVEAGADMIDVGGESTRPGNPGGISVEEEWNRMREVIGALARDHPTLPVSVDTVKSEIARRALDAGAWVVNDVSTLRLDPAIAEVCAEYEAGLVLNHSRGSFSDMAGYEEADYHDVTAETAGELLAAVEVAVDRGMTREQIVLDPGLGFAKTPEQSFELLRELPYLVSFGLPVMVGPSRKRFLGTITGRDVAERDTATAAACVAAFLRGAHLFRVHNVRQVKEALAVAEKVRSA